MDEKILCRGEIKKSLVGFGIGGGRNHAFNYESDKHDKAFIWKPVIRNADHRNIGSI
jgi:hypothetical protein